MRIWCKSFLDITTEQIFNKYFSYKLDYPDDSELLNVLWTDFNTYDGLCYELFLGTLFINYIEMNAILLFEEGQEFAQKVCEADFWDIKNLFESNIDLFDDAVQCTLEKNSMSSSEKEEIYQMIINSKFANIYSRFDPLFEQDKMIHNINYPTDPIQKVDSKFYDTYFYLKEYLDYEDHIFYILKDLIQHKYDKEDSDNLLTSLATSYYYFTKGRVLLEDKTVTLLEKNLLDQLEINHEEKARVSLLRQNDQYLDLIIQKCCFYQEHLLDKEQIAVYQKEEQTQYMKHFTSKAKESTK